VIKSSLNTFKLPVTVKVLRRVAADLWTVEIVSTGMLLQVVMTALLIGSLGDRILLKLIIFHYFAA